jgi:DNA invertase Pin-like site-specific DNA recombinase
MPTLRPAFAVRLSREDLSLPGSIEEKLALRVAMCHELAARYGLPAVCPEDIYLEGGVSGRSLAKRPRLLELLARCRERYYTHILSPYQDRLLRGDKHDEATIEDAFLDGEITLITTEGVTRFDASYDASHALTFEVRAAAARHYLRDVIHKLKQSNRARAQRGQRSAGMAPFGYVWITARYDARRLVDPPHYEIVGTLAIADAAAALAYATENGNEQLLKRNGNGNGTKTELDIAAYLTLARRQGLPGGGLLPGVVCTGGEYATLTTIFHAIRSQGAAAVTASLNARGVPPPGATRFANFGGTRWHEYIVRRIVANRHYAGFPAHTVTTNRRGEKVALAREQWVLPDAEQPYPHPLTLSAQEALLERIAARGRQGAARPSGKSLLSGILHCAAGRPTRCNTTAYACRCRADGQAHSGGTLLRRVGDDLAYHLIAEALARYRPASAPLPGKGRSAPVSDTEALLAKKRREKEDLLRHQAVFARSGAGEGFLAAQATLEAEIAALLTQAQAERQEAETREIAAAGTLLEALRNLGLAAWWTSVGSAERRALLRFVVAEIKVVAPRVPRAHITHVTVAVQPWIAAYYDPGTLDIRHLQKAPSEGVDGASV